MLKALRYTFITLLMVPALGFSPLANAHGPARVKVVHEIEVNASADAVWDVVKDICSIKDWNSVVTDCKANGGNEQGASRDLTLENGEVIKEVLSKYDPESKRILSTLQLEQGRIIKGMPIATLGTFLTVKENGSGSIVELKGAFYRAFPGQQPPPELTDEACKEAVSKLYMSGLEGIKQTAESK